MQGVSTLSGWPCFPLTPSISPFRLERVNGLIVVRRHCVSYGSRHASKRVLHLGMEDVGRAGLSDIIESIQYMQAEI